MYMSYNALETSEFLLLLFIRLLTPILFLLHWEQRR